MNIKRSLALGVGFLALAGMGAGCKSESVATSDSDIIQGGSKNLLLGRSFALQPGDLALTFDDGPSTETIDDPVSHNPTLVLARELHRRGIPTTFFQIAQFFKEEVDKQILSFKGPDGKPFFHIANHTMHHIILDTLPRDATGNAKVISEVLDADAILAPWMAQSLGLDDGPHDRHTEYRLFRAPGGQITNNHFTAAETQSRIDALFNADPDAASRYIGPVYWDVGGFTASNGVYTGDFACPGAHISLEDCATGYFNEIVRLKAHGEIVLAHDSHAFTVKMFTMPGGVLDKIDDFNRQHPEAPFRYVHLDSHQDQIKTLLDRTPPDITLSSE